MMDRILQIRVPSREMTPERLDTGYYSAEYFRARKAIDESGISSPLIGDVSEPWCFGAYALCNEIKWAQADGGIPYLKAEALGTPLLKEDALSFVTPETHRLLEKSRLIRGDIIVSTSGTVGLCAVIPDHIPEANSNQDTIKFRLPSEDFDSSFVATWLSCRIAQAIMRREAGGAVQQHIYLYNFKRLPLLKPSRTVQRYIGDKVRQAERLRNTANKASRLSEAIVAALLEGEISEENLIQGLFPPSRAPVSSSSITIELLQWFQSRKVSVQSVAAWSRVGGTFLHERLDSRYYRPEFLRLNVLLRSRGAIPLNELTEKVECGPFGGNAIAESIYEANGLPFLRPVNLTGNRLKTTDLVRVSEATLRSNGLKVYSGENLYFARVGTPAVALFDGKASISPNIIIAKGDPGKADIGYLYCFCKSAFGIQQLDQELKEGVQPTTSTDAVRQLQVLLPDMRIQEHVGNLCRSSERSLTFTASLLTAAKMLVEGLIEGTITEGELVDAQQGLERGDRALEHAILSRLTENGIDVAGKLPLFQDLDALYTVIDESHRTQSSNGDAV